MRSAAARSPRAGADLIDLNMGCPVPEGHARPARAPRCSRTPTPRSRSRAPPREGSGLPVTVKLRAGRKPGEREGVEVARRLVEEAGVAGITLPPAHAPRCATRARPDYDLAAELVAGAARAGDRLRRHATSAEHIRWVFEHTGVRGGHARPRLARQPVAVRAGARRRATGEPTREEVLDEWTGSSTARRSTSGPSAPRATCASSIPGTSSASARPRRVAGRAPARRRP